MLGTFAREHPIDDAMTVLDLLVRRWGDDTHRRLHARVSRLRSCKDGPRVSVAHCRDFGDDTIYDFYVTDRVVQELRSLGWVSGEPKWGYTDENTMHASDSGVLAHHRERERLDVPNQDAGRRFCTERWFQETHP